MIDYFIKHHDKLLTALLEHIEIVAITLVISLVIATSLTVLAMSSKAVSRMLIYTFSMIYSIPSIALFALLIPLTGLGTVTSITVLVLYNQYLLLRNFIEGLNEVEPSIVEAATGLGMSSMQVLMKIRLPLSYGALFTGVHLAVVSTIGIATIAATINAGGLGTILFDGLRTMNINKILWGTILSAGLAITANALLGSFEKRLKNMSKKYELSKV